MNKLFAAAGVGVVLCSGAALADPDPTRVPLQNAIETVGGQAAQHPGNRGLGNATIRLQENAIRQQEKRDEHAAEHPGQGGPADRAETVTRVEKAERPEKVERVERVERAERPDRVVRVDRPVPPGQAYKRTAQRAVRKRPPIPQGGDTTPPFSFVAAGAIDKTC
jgi:hypothetical protein